MFNIPQNSFVAMAVILGALITATTTRLILKYKYPEKEKAHTELRQRIQSWWWMIALLFIVLWINQTTAIFFFGFLSFLALKEFLSVVPIRQADRRVIFWAYLSIPFQYYWIGAGMYDLFIIFIPVFVFLFLPMRMVLIGETRGFINSAGTIHWATMLTVFCISHIAFLLKLPSVNPAAGNIGLVLFLIIFTQFNDVSQYIWGKTLGKHKIIPKVSPNKTWEGFIGGLLTISLLSTVIAPLLTPLNHWQGFFAGMIISFGGFIGDVVISSVKRDLQIKDTGQLIPGHGGILDRLDSLIYTTPLFFHYLYFLHVKM